MGPLTVADMNGLDVNEKLKSENGWAANDFEKEMWRTKRFGRKTSRDSEVDSEFLRIWF